MRHLLGLEQLKKMKPTSCQVNTARSARAYSSANPGLTRRAGEETINVVRGSWPYGLLNPQVEERYLEKWGEST